MNIIILLRSFYFSLKIVLCLFFIVWQFLKTSLLSISRSELIHLICYSLHIHVCLLDQHASFVIFGSFTFIDIGVYLFATYSFEKEENADSIQVHSTVKEETLI